MKLPSLAEVRKFAVSLVGVAGMAVASGYLHGRVLLDVESGIGIVTAALTYFVPNAGTSVAKPVLGDVVFAPETPAAPVAAVSVPVPGTAPAPTA